MILHYVTLYHIIEHIRGVHRQTGRRSSELAALGVVVRRHADATLDLDQVCGSIAAQLGCMDAVSQTIEWQLHVSIC